jgi:hypothetical protein
VKHEVISRCYNLLIKAMFDNRFSDAQCGFKAIKGSVAQELVLQVKDGEWFFDTELLLVAEEQGYHVSEVPLDWIEDLDSRVNIASTAIEDVKGLCGCGWSACAASPGNGDAVQPHHGAPRRERCPRQVVSSAKKHRQMSVGRMSAEQPPQRGWSTHPCCPIPMIRRDKVR